jgi:uncharacterized membrane protein YfcA
MIASLLGILGGFILIMLGVIIGVHSDIIVGVLVMFAGLVSMFHFLPHCNK